MRDLTERAKIDLETINNKWFIELLSIVIKFNAQELAHNAKELIQTIKDLGTLIHDQTIMVATFRSLMKVKTESFMRIQGLLNIAEE